VRLRAVVTYYSPAGNDLFIQDKTAGIYVSPAETNLDIKPGQLVQIEGFSGPGDFAPVIARARVNLLGEGEMPSPRLASFEQLMTGQQDSQLIEIRGVVRLAELKEGEWILKVAMNGGQLEAAAPAGNDLSPETLVDSEVRIRGTCATIFNQRRQLVG